MARIVSWLPAVLPADTASIRVGDPAMAEVLRRSGVDVAETADVELTWSTPTARDGAVVIVAVEPTRHSGERRVRHALAAPAEHAAAHRRARSIAHELRKSGYRLVRTIPWDLGKPLPGAGVPRLQARMNAAVSQRFLVVAERARAAPTLLDAIVAEAERTSGRRLSGGRSHVRGESLLVFGPDAVLRLGVGGGIRILERETQALGQLLAAAPGPDVADRVPWPIAGGRLGAATWVLNERLPGRSVDPSSLPKRLLPDCLDFLLGLREVGQARDAGTPSLGAAAETVGRVCDESERVVIRRLSTRLDEQLADLPTVFSHGDLWSPNLLTHRRGLTGVVDWDAGTPCGLPLVDLIHLRLTPVRRRRRLTLGAAVVDQLLPWARAGGDPVAKTYCRRVGFEPTRTTIVTLALAYWLTQIARNLITFVDRPLPNMWLQQNVFDVIRALSAEEERP